MDGSKLKNDYPDYEDQIEYIEDIPAQRAEERDPFRVLDNEKLSERLPFESLFSHQADALEHLDNGDNVCVTTPTSSGKTLIYVLHIAREYLRSKDSTALLIYPTKALSRDQETEINKIYEQLGLDIEVGVYDGDTSRQRKQQIRKDCNVIITNLQGLNYYLPYHTKWSKIFSNLRTIVIDEAHTYTGIQGIHVSWIIRRLKRICEGTYNSEPQFVLSSATIGNPKEHSRNLTGENFEIVDNDGSPRGKRSLVIWNPPSYMDDGTLERRSSNRESSDLLSYLISNDIQTIMFCSSRKTTEICSKWTQDTLDNDYAGFYEVNSYNAGHRKDDRRKVESKLKKGEIDGVVSTTALELGIDIGDVDSTIMNGYPGRKSSFWQQAGRSGRGTSNALSVLVSRHNSIDQYIVNNPNYLLNKDVENAVVDLSNEHILSKHLCAAANEKPLRFTSDVANYFSDAPIVETIEDLVEKGLLKGDILDGDDVKYIGSNERPESEIDLYSTSDEQYNVYIDLGDDEFELPSVDKSRAFREFHPHAIYMYKGEQYEVTNFDISEKEIKLEYTNANYYTQSSRNVSIKDIREIQSKKISDGITAKKGSAIISESYSTYTRIYFDDGRKESNLPTGLDEPIELETDVFWIEFSEDRPTEIETNSGKDGLAGSLHATEHSLIKMSPTILTADTKDLGGLSMPYNEDTGVPTIFIYDGIEGGVGFSHEIYDEISKLSTRTRELLSSCECNSDRGCPACTMSSMCGDNNEPMDTKGSQYILSLIN